MNIPHPLISVIVPVYKVELYLERCIDSIINQTYTNLEIILVDDGSPDKCGTICDDYAKLDARIKVVHQENQGLSAARNTGLTLATGELIAFVDSDDWLEVNMYSKLWEAMEKTNSDIVVCNFFLTDGIKKESQRHGPTRILDTTEGIRNLIIDKEINNYAVNKLYKREFFQEVSFPEGEVMEDIKTMYKVFHQAKRITYIANYLYNYFQRSDSILGSKNLATTVEHLKAISEQCLFIKNNYPQFLLLNEWKFLQSMHFFQKLYYLNSSQTETKGIDNILIKEIIPLFQKLCAKYKDDFQDLQLPDLRNLSSEATLALLRNGTIIVEQLMNKIDVTKFLLKANPLAIPLISICIPVYNTATYLPKLLNSLLAQTYENLQIILVDDGSTDGSSSICDEYAFRDERIEVWHTERKGVSFARNLALKAASGSFIGFADSDDYLEPDMYEKLLRTILEKQADIVCCNFDYIQNGKSRIHSMGEACTLDKIAGLKVLIEDKEVNNFLWNKLFRKELWKGITFYGSSLVDLRVVYKAFMKAETIALTPEVYYHYVQRPNSIIGTNNQNLTLKTEFCLSQQERFYGLKDTYPELKPLMLAKYRQALSILIQYGNDYPTKKDMEAAGNIQKRIVPFVRGFLKEQLPQIKQLEALAIDDYMTKTKALEAKLQQALAAKDKMEQQLKNEKKKSAKLQKEFNKECHRRKSMEGSLSFRLGRALTWLPRKLFR